MRVRKHVGQYRIEGFGYTFARGRRWWIRYWRRGTEHREPARSLDEKVAYRLLKRRHGEIVGQTFVSPREERVRFAELARGLVEKYTLQQRRSLTTVQLRLRHLAAFLGEDRALDLTTARLQAYQAHRRQAAASPATVNRELSVLHRAFVIAARAGLLTRVPTVPRTARGECRARGDARTGGAPGDPAPPPPGLPGRARLRARDGLAQEGDLHAGLARRGSRGRDGASRRRVREEQGHPGAAALADGARAPDPPLGGAPAGLPAGLPGHGRTGYHGWQKAWAAARTAAGLEGKVLHDTRRTVARDLRRSGVTETTAMRITGQRVR